MRMDLLVNDFVWRATNDHAVTLFEAHFRRCYIHVRDVAYAFLHALDKRMDMRGKAYNVGLSDSNLSKLDLCKRIQKHIPEFVFTEASIGEDIDKRDYIVSNARIEATGFKPRYSLDDGIRELIMGYRQLGKVQYGNV
jgi:nucleoside-diphosphate-sugar epimerase